MFRCSGLLVVSTLALAPLDARADEPAKAAPASETKDADSGTLGAEMNEWSPGSPGRLDLGVGLGFGGRADDPPIYQLTEPFGLLFGGSIDMFFSKRVSVGLAYEHLDLGAEHSGLTDFGEVSVTRDLNTMWLNLRLYPVQQPSVGAYLRIAAAMSWQSADLQGNVWNPVQPHRRLALRCEGSDTPGLGLRAELGLDVRLSESVGWTTAGMIDGYGLSSDLMDDCAPGAGSAMVFGLRSGFAYGWSL